MSKIILITGCPGCGKSTIGQALAKQFPSGVHLRVDAIRESMVSGFAPPGEWTPEAKQQFRLAREVGTYWARTYVAEGIDVVIDDVCIPELFTEHYAALFAQPNVHRVLLNPSREVLAERITQRGGPYAEFFVQRGIPYVSGLIEAMPKQGWIVVDSSAQTIEQTLHTVMNSL
jgi:predicted kinase